MSSSFQATNTEVAKILAGKVMEIHLRAKPQDREELGEGTQSPKNKGCGVTPARVQSSSLQLGPDFIPVMIETPLSAEFHSAPSAAQALYSARDVPDTKGYGNNRAVNGFKGLLIKTRKNLSMVTS